MGFFQAAGGLIKGGFDAVGNVIGSVGKGAGYMVSGFFPSSQRKEPIVSEIVMPAEGSGRTYRPTDPDAPSLAEIAAYAQANWLGSPYEDQLAPGPGYTTRKSDVTTGIQTAADSILGLSGTLSSAVSAAGDLVSQIRTQWGLSPRTVQENTAGEKIVYLQDDRSGAPQTTPADGGLMQDFVNQLKGLFNIGFPQQPQPSPTIAQPAAIISKPLITSQVIVLIVIAALVYFLSRD